MKKFTILLLTVAVVASIVFAGCARPDGGAGPTPLTELKAKDVPELQQNITTGCLDPELPLNPFGADFLTKPDGTPYRITYINIFVYCDWCYNQGEIIQSLIGRAGGVCTHLDPNYGLEKQIGFIEDVAATKNADAVIVTPVDEYMIVQAVDKCSAAGIPVFATCQQVYSDTLISFCGHDYGANFIPGYGCDCIGQYYRDVADKTGEEIHIYELWGNRGQETSVFRHEGFHKGIADHPLITVSESPDSMWDTALMADFVIDAFTADPTLNAVFQHGGGTSGIVEGLKTVGQLYPVGDPNHVLFATNECDTEIALAMDKDMIDAFSTNSPLPQAHVVVQNLFWYVVLGQAVERTVWMPMIVITPENIDTARQGEAPAAWSRLPTGMWDIWPALDCSEWGIEYPTKELRKQYQGY